MTWLLKLSSHEFLDEVLRYDTYQEACEGAVRIFQSSAELNDGIERTVEIIKAPAEGNAEEN
ncbi:MAG: hypothetical protein AB1491_00235 [Thermodesulfobacteriota bacterium]